jgi:hypothetical protein
MRLDPSAQKLEIAVSEATLPGGCTVHAAKTKYLPYRERERESLQYIQYVQEQEQCLQDEQLMSVSMPTRGYSNTVSDSMTV